LTSYGDGTGLSGGTIPGGLAPGAGGYGGVYGSGSAGANGRVAILW